MESGSAQLQLADKDTREKLLLYLPSNEMVKALHSYAESPDLSQIFKLVNQPSSDPQAPHNVLKRLFGSSEPSIKDTEINPPDEIETKLFAIHEELHQSTSNQDVANTVSKFFNLDQWSKPRDLRTLRESITSTTVSSEGLMRDWNAELQEIKNMDPDKFKKFRTIAEDFQMVATMYGRIIISEYHLPVERKTIKPVDVGGIAGGQKFIVSGILFKMSLDLYGLYGGGIFCFGRWLISIEENAMKVAAHDIKGLELLFHSRIEGLHFPLVNIFSTLKIRCV